MHMEMKKHHHKRGATELQGKHKQDLVAHLFLGMFAAT